MGIRFACHHCGRRLNIKNDLAGRRGVCPGCEGRFRIPPRDADFSLTLVDDDSSAKPAAGQSPENANAGHAGTKGSSRSSAESESLSDPDAAWYVRPSGGGQYGPADGAKLTQWIDEGRVATDSLVWRDGWPQWRVAEEAFPSLATKMPKAVQDRGAVAEFVASASQAAAGSDSVNPQPSGVMQLQGDPAIGATRGKRSDRRGLSLGVLAGVCVALVGVLIYIVSR